MHAILGKGRRVRHLGWHRPDFDIDSKRAQNRHVVGVKFGDRARHEWDDTYLAFIGSKHQGVVDEVELRLERSATPRDGGRGQPASRDIESDLPPVILHW
jgi:hypothetical protein